MQQNEVDLLFLKDQQDKRLRLCIPKGYVGALFKIYHDDANHCGYNRSYGRIAKGFYVHRLHQELKAYIASCPSCQVNQTLRTKVPGLLEPIESGPEPFHTLTLDLIVKLPHSNMSGKIYDSIMSITDKFSKAIILAPGKETYKANEWAQVFFDNVVRRWGIPSGMISDRGAIFLSKFWTTVFTNAKVKLFTTTSYHPQGDGQSERTNQTIEIILRHYVNRFQDDWAKHLPIIEMVHNNLKSASTERSPNEIIYGKNLRTGPEILAEGTSSTESGQFTSTVAQIRREARDAISFAKLRMSKYYNDNRRPENFEIGDYVWIELARTMMGGYAVRGMNSRKLGPQRSGPFRVIRKVGNLAYELDLEGTMTVNPVFSIVYLRRANLDEYGRNVPPPAQIDDEGIQVYEVEELLAKRFVGQGRTRRVEYLVSWKNYDAIHNSWEPIVNLEGSKDAVDEFERKRVMFIAEE